MDQQCLFCQIIAGAIPATIVGETKDSLAFHDIEPAAPTHVLVIPKNHVENLGELAEDAIAVSDLFKLADTVADELGLDGGYRLIANTGEDAGQLVFHAHVHLLGGRTMQWPPG